MTAGMPAGVFVLDGLRRGTSALIAPGVLVTAAHCVVDRASALITLGAERGVIGLPDRARILTPTGLPLTGRCVVHTDYVRIGRPDIACCLLDGAPSVAPMQISLDATFVQPGRDLVLIGTGMPDADGARAARRLIARVTRIASGEVMAEPIAGGPLVFGDSGGPACTIVDGEPIVVGVISGSVDGAIAIATLPLDFNRRFARIP